MRKLFKKILLFSIPFVLYLILVVIIDPFTFYKKNDVVDKNRKDKIAIKIEPHLFKLIDYGNNPKTNILLGDSRSNRLYENIETHSNNWSTLAYGAASLNEVCETMQWIIEEDFEIDTVLIGINFNLYNKYNKRNWVEETVVRKKNIFSYAFSSYAAKASFYILKEIVFGIEVEIGKPKISKDLFWQKSVNNYGNKFYAKYGYPDDYKNRLKLISEHCKKNNIKLIFWIPPCSEELNQIVDNYNLSNERDKFYLDLNELGKVYNFNKDKIITQNRDNFTDPAHFNFEIGETLYNTIFKKQ